MDRGAASLVWVAEQSGRMQARVTTARMSKRSPTQHVILLIYRCCSVAQLYLTLCDPMDCSMPGFPALHCLQEFAQTHVHWVGDTIQPSRPLSPTPAPLRLLLEYSRCLIHVRSFVSLMSIEDGCIPLGEVKLER